MRRSNLPTLLSVIPLSLTLSAASLFAGEEVDVLGRSIDRPFSPDKISDDDEWLVAFRPYLWTVSIEGVQGVNGIVAPIDLSFSDVIRNVDMVWASTLEIQKGRWGLLVDTNYMKLSAGIDEVPFDIFSAAGIKLKQFIGGAAVMYRVAEWDRGFLDVGGGVQYTWLDQELSLEPDNAGITRVSRDLSRELVDRAAASIRQRLAGVTLPAPPVGGGAGLPAGFSTGMEERVGSGAIRDELQRLVGDELGDQFGSGVAGNRRVDGALRELIAAIAAERAAQARGAVTSKVRKKLADARARAESRLAREIEGAIKRGIPRNAGLTESWWDPFVAMRVRHYLTEKLYLNLFAMYGGFGVGADEVWQIGVGPGFEIKENLTLEFYYRYYSVDYQNGGFLYDSDVSGLFLGIVLEF